MLKSCGWLVGGGGLQDFSVSPSRVLLGLIGLDSVWGDWGLRDWRLGLDKKHKQSSKKSTTVTPRRLYIHPMSLF